MNDDKIIDDVMVVETLFISFNASYHEKGFTSTANIIVEGLGKWEMKDLVSKELIEILSKEIIAAVKDRLGVNSTK